MIKHRETAAPGELPCFCINPDGTWMDLMVVCVCVCGLKVRERILADLLSGFS